MLQRIAVPLPPLEEQKRIAAILDQADALRRLRRRALDRLNTLGQAIFREMFGDCVRIAQIHDGLRRSWRCRFEVLTAASRFRSTGLHPL